MVKLWDVGAGILDIENLRDTAEKGIARWVSRVEVEGEASRKLFRTASCLGRGEVKPMLSSHPRHN